MKKLPGNGKLFLFLGGLNFSKFETLEKFIIYELGYVAQQHKTTKVLAH